MRATRQFLERRGLLNQLRHNEQRFRQSLLLQQFEHTSWRETPNDYVEKDLGYQMICGQRVRAKRVYDTAGTNFLILGDEFKVGKVS